jgi:hypothetical protein
MMVPPTIAHQRIADNLTRLINDALAEHDPANVSEFARVPDLLWQNWNAQA